MRLKKIPGFYQIGLRYPRTVLLVSFVLTLVSFFYSSKLQLITDFNSFLPESTKSVANLHFFKQHFGSFEYAVLTIEGKDNDRAKELAGKLAEKIRGNPEVSYVDYEKPVEYFKQRQWLYLDIPDLREMERRVDRSLILQKKGVSPVFAGLMDFADEDNRPDLTFEDIRKKYEDKIKKEWGAGDSESGDSPFEIIFVKLRQPPDDFAYNRKIMEEFKTAEAEVRKTGDYGSLTVGYTGDYQGSLEQVAFTEKEISKVSLIVFVSLFAIIFLYYRRWSAPLLIGIPLLMSIGWTGGLAYLFFGHLNVITSFAAAILAGLGSDYGIYLLSRFEYARKQGDDFSRACEMAFAHTGKATFGSVITNAGAFAALMFSGFKVFVEFGAVGALGMVTTYLSMVLVLPAFLVLTQRWSGRSRFWNSSVWRKLSPDRWCLKIFGAQRSFLGVALALLTVIVAAFSLPSQSRIYFQDGDFNSDTLDSSRLYSKVSQASWGTLQPGVLITKNAEAEAKTLDHFHPLTETISPQKSVFQKVLGLSSFVPKEQEAKREILLRLKEKFSALTIVAKGQRDKMIASLEDTVQASSVSIENLPLEIKRRFESIDKSGFLAIFLYPAISRSSQENIERYQEGIVEAKEASGVDFIPVDPVFIQLDIVNLIKQEAKVGLGLLVLFLFGFLLLTIKPAARCLLIMAHLLAALVTLSGVLWLADIPLNIINIAMIPIILGTGIDCFLHLSLRYDESYRMEEAIVGQIPSILISNLTSIVGFGGLILTSASGLRSAGWVAVLGLLLVTIFCVFVFPRSLLLTTPRTKSRFAFENEPA